MPDYDQEYTKAQIASMQANAVQNLVEAADVLGSMGRDELADRVLLALGELLPQREDRRASPEKAEAVDPRENTVGQTDQSATMANQPLTQASVDEFEGMPQGLKDYINDMRAQGFTIEVVSLPL
ncbi:hypothetical protein D3C86_1851600 [compost metagenome]